MTAQRARSHDGGLASRASAAHGPVNGRALGAVRIGIAVSRFNPSVTQALFEGAQHVLRRAGILSPQIRTLWVPGAFELPAAAAHLVASRPRPHAVIALGALIRGRTPQYRAIAAGVAQGLCTVSAQSRVPVTFGVIVVNSPAQARARAGGRLGNRGAEAAAAALDMVRCFRATARRHR